MEQFDTPPTFESEQVQPTEMERLVDRMQNFSIGLTPATAQATLATVTRGLEQGMFKIEELDAIITIREEVNKGIIEYNGQMKQAQERMQVLQQEEVIKQQEEIANRIERERVKVRDERQLRKSTQDRLKLMEDALAKAGITIDLDGDGVIGLPAGEVATPLTQTEQQRVDQIVADTPAPTPAPAPKPTSGAFKLARMMNPSEEPVVPLDTPQSHTVIPSPVETNKPISENEEFVGQIEAAKKSFAEFVEPKEVILEPTTIIPEDANTSTEDFLEEVELVATMNDLEEKETEEDYLESFPSLANISSGVSSEDQMEMDLIDEEEFNASFDMEDELAVPVEDDTVPFPTLDIGYESSKPVVSGGNAPNLKASVPTAPTITAPVLEENDVVLKQSDIKVFEEDLTEPVEDEDEYEEISIPSPSELNVMTKSGILKEADKLGFELTGTKNQMIEQFSEQTEAFIAQLQEDGEFLSASDTDEGVEDDGDENNRDGGYF